MRLLASVKLVLLFHALTFSNAFAQDARVWTEFDLEPIRILTQEEIDAGRIPGAVILIGTKDRVSFRAAYGSVTLASQVVPMTVNTIFDLASVTKVVATTTAVMQLVERNKVKLNEPVFHYWPQFGTNGKREIAVHHLLTHYSGLRADLDLKNIWSGYFTAMNLIASEKPVSRPGERYIYSDINFEILGELVRRITNAELDQYCADYIFGPMKMTQTRFRPSSALLERIAPTKESNNGSFWGKVHDPTARRMGGVAGHAGLFSTADDLAIFARMILNGGIVDGTRVLSQGSVQLMSSRQSPPKGPRARGYGWDLGGPDGYLKAPLGTFGHFGYTGTMIWIDPFLETYAIALTNRVYLERRGDADSLRQTIIGLLSTYR